MKVTLGKVVNIYISYEINLWSFKLCEDPTQGNSLFGVVKLVKNADIYKYKFSGYGIGFDTKDIFSLSNAVFLVDSQKLNNIWC